jgi:hypothetical protein
MDKPDFSKLLNEIYERGADPDILMTTLDQALHYGLIGRFEYGWRKVLQTLHIPQPNIRWPDDATRAKRQRRTGAFGQDS